MYFFEVSFNDFIQYTRNGGGGLKPAYVDIRELHAVISLTTENDGNLFFKQQNVWHSCTSIVLREIRNIGKRRGNETDSCNVLLHFTFFEHSTYTFHISWNSLRITGKRFSFLHLLSKKKKTSHIAASTKEVTFKNVVGLVVAAIVGFFFAPYSRFSFFISSFSASEDYESSWQEYTFPPNEIANFIGQCSQNDIRLQCKVVKL